MVKRCRCAVIEVQAWPVALGKVPGEVTSSTVAMDVRRQLRERSMSDPCVHADLESRLGPT